ncbi:LmbU family transcriptional regulator [Streptomyces sp. Isolate_219]|uniref:LmbU family transcriptional regulator n=1 Tax=Streptomyces sp. Isolate_219 TaxID=2950110 RepID=UPI0021C966CB|nr:LmbU family transcriptional regulator [Streptomyces sp. Isolate_219]MCR8579123.1 LmbU family transcriptional regulator [Streptomyces sp. Isolate_219]
MLTTDVGLEIPEGLPFEDWERAGRQLSGVVNSSTWWLGDWLVYGKEHYRDRYERGVLAAGLQYQTLRNYAWVAGRFELHRRRPALSFQHHAEVASLPAEEQDRWLDRAEKLKWSTKQLREGIRLARADDVREAEANDTTRRLMVPGSKLQRWHLAAAQSGTDLRQWVLLTLDQAARAALQEDAAHPIALTSLRIEEEGEHVAS